MRQGELVTVVRSGDYGKPRPVIILQQGDAFGLDGRVLYRCHGMHVLPHREEAI